MKKSLIFLSLFATLALGGCAQSSEKLEAIEPIAPETAETFQADTSQVENEAAPESTTPPATATPTTLPSTQHTYTILTIPYEQERYASDDESVLLASCSYDVPHMIATDEAGNTLEDDAIAAAFNASFVDWDNGENFNEITLWATEQYQSDPDFFKEYACYYTDELDCWMYQIEHLVSVSGMYYSFTGGAHGNTGMISWLFDTNSGTFISPLALATDSQAMLDGVTALLAEQCVTKASEYDLAPDELYWENYMEVLSDWPSYSVVFDPAGMWVSFSPYELAAYAAGPQVFYVTYEQLAPYFTPQASALFLPE